MELNKAIASKAGVFLTILGIAVLVPTAAVNADAVPNPGELLVVSNLSLAADGSCDGTLQAAYSRIPGDPGHIVALDVDDECAIVPTWYWSEDPETFVTTVWGFAKYSHAEGTLSLISLSGPIRIGGTIAPCSDNMLPQFDSQLWVVTDDYSTPKYVPCGSTHTTEFVCDPCPTNIACVVNCSYVRASVEYNVWAFADGSEYCTGTTEDGYTRRTYYCEFTPREEELPLDLEDYTLSNTFAEVPPGTSRELSPERP